VRERAGKRRWTRAVMCLGAKNRKLRRVQERKSEADINNKKRLETGGRSGAGPAK